MARKPSLRIVTVVIKTIATEERDGVHLQIQQEQMGTYSQRAGLGWKISETIRQRERGSF